ncbi:MAG TPA: MaoC/PaaZ C-terminal domain-containing protein [Acidimicrobiia bacterium]|jgi:acyl dehydratase|nr:MaoC/PaaZ C-terminal domain-containing protein [Acidimicrobiia bacterium]
MPIAPSTALGASLGKPADAYGIVCKAVVDTLLDGEVAAVSRYQVRFTGVVLPGETVVTSMWREDDRILLSATTRERGQRVLSNAAIWTR